MLLHLCAPASEVEEDLEQTMAESRSDGFWVFSGTQMCSELEQHIWELSEVQGRLGRLKCYLGCLETTELVESE